MSRRDRVIVLFIVALAGGFVWLACPPVVEELYEPWENLR
jgi:hypothetical protein